MNNLSVPATSQVLDDVIGFIEVFDSDGADASSDILVALNNLGAQVDPEFKIGLTHMIWANGNIRHVRAAEFMDIVVVTPKWIGACRKAGRKVDESPFIVDPDVEEVVSKARMPVTHVVRLDHSQGATALSSTTHTSTTPTCTSTASAIAIGAPSSSELKKRPSLALRVRNSPTLVKPEASPCSTDVSATSIVSRSHASTEDSHSGPHDKSALSLSYVRDTAFGNMASTPPSRTVAVRVRSEEGVRAACAVGGGVVSTPSGDADGSDDLVDTPPSSPIHTMSTGEVRERSGSGHGSSVKRGLVRLRKASPLSTTLPIDGPTPVVRSMSKRKALAARLLDACSQESEGEGYQDREGGAVWQCVACTFLNTAGNVICQVCEASRTQSFSSQQTCPLCTFLNEAQAMTCDVCGERLQPAKLLRSAARAVSSFSSSGTAINGTAHSSGFPVCVSLGSSPSRATGIRAPLQAVDPDRLCRNGQKSNPTLYDIETVRDKRRNGDDGALGTHSDIGVSTRWCEVESNGPGGRDDVVSTSTSFRGGGLYGLHFANASDRDTVSVPPEADCSRWKGVPYSEEAVSSHQLNQGQDDSEYIEFDEEDSDEVPDDYDFHVHSSQQDAKGESKSAADARNVYTLDFAEEEESYDDIEDFEDGAGYSMEPVASIPELAEHFRTVRDLTQCPGCCPIDFRSFSLDHTQTRVSAQYDSRRAVRDKKAAVAASKRKRVTTSSGRKKKRRPVAFRRKK